MSPQYTAVFKAPGLLSVQNTLFKTFCSNSKIRKWFSKYFKSHLPKTLPHPHTHREPAEAWVLHRGFFTATMADADGLGVLKVSTSTSSHSSSPFALSASPRPRRGFVLFSKTPNLSWMMMSCEKIRQGLSVCSRGGRGLVLSPAHDHMCASDIIGHISLSLASGRLAPCLPRHVWRRHFCSF